MSVAFSPDGQLALTGSRDKTARLWEVATRRELHRLEEHHGSIMSVAFSPDGRLALTGSVDHTVRLWDVATGQCAAMFPTDSEVLAVAFSPCLPLTVCIGESSGHVLFFRIEL